MAGLGIAVSSITYAAISAYASIITDKDKQVSWQSSLRCVLTFFMFQGAIQGTLMGIRGLCNGLGPAAFGLMWHLFGINIHSEYKLPGAVAANITGAGEEVFLGSNLTQVTLGSEDMVAKEVIELDTSTREGMGYIGTQMPGLPFLIISVCVVLALGCSVFLKPITIEETTKTEEAAHEANSESQNSSSGVPLAKEETEENNP